jgi:[ribosomal protein S18]-alanine N-acetyltransferase
MTTDATGANPAFDRKRLSLLWAVQGQAAEISRLHRSMFAIGWDEAAIAGLLAHPGSVGLVAAHGSPPILGGFALAQVAADEAEILTLGVTEAWRRHGVGAQLVAGIMRAAARAGARSLFLEVADGNAAARAMYARAGFTEAGRRAGYYAREGAPQEDALVLKTTLEASAGR